METVNFGNDVCKQSGIFCGGPAIGGLEYALRNSGKMLFGFGRDGGLLANPRSARAPGVGERPCNSFTPDTQVLLADGKHKAISKIKLGDKVLATDPTTGKTKPEPVVALIAGNGTKHLTTITIDTDGGKGHHAGTITATDQHPFWVTTTRPHQKPSGHWANAADLHSDTHLRTSNGHTVQIITTRHYAQSQIVNNLTIANLHLLCRSGHNTRPRPQQQL
jgi:hypothetical protein